MARAKSCCKLRAPVSGGCRRFQTGILRVRSVCKVSEPSSTLRLLNRFFFTFESLFVSIL
ncbi:hypothetical protein LINGRAHAP2_LOCUS21070 [Linum grandiflorum]